MDDLLTRLWSIVYLRVPFEKRIVTTTCAKAADEIKKLRSACEEWESTADSLARCIGMIQSGLDPKDEIIVKRVNAYLDQQERKI